MTEVCELKVDFDNTTSSRAESIGLNIEMKIYSAEEARPLILNGSLKGEYAVIGSLSFKGCDLTGITLPTEVDDWLDLRFCDLTGITLPVKVGVSLYLNCCKNPDPSQWWRERGPYMKRHCLAISDYALIETEDGLYSAGCHGPWTAKQALAHWEPRKDQRAKLFVKAIKANEKRKH